MSGLKPPATKKSSDLRNFLILTAAVAGCHILLIVLLEAPWDAFKTPVRRERALQVQTVALQKPLPISSMPPVIEEETAAPVPIEEEIPSPPEEPKAVPKPAVPPPAPKKNVEKKPKPQPVKKPPAVKEQKKDLQKEAREAELYRQAQESIAKITGTPPKSPSKKTGTTPKQIQSLQVDSKAIFEDSNDLISSQEHLYQDELALRLRCSLQLPEYGEVKLKLTLSRNGTVADVKILKAESKRNQQYLQNNLKTVRFPAFGSSFRGQEQHTFTITLNNE